MMLFEIKRFIRNKDVFFILVTIVVVFIFNFVLEKVFYNNEIGSSVRLGNLYNSFAQFIFLAFSPILGTLIAKDYEKNVIAFYYNNGISSGKYFFNRILAFCLIFCTLFTFIFVFYCLILNLNMSNSLLVLLFILQNMIILIGYSGLLGLIVKKRGKTSMLLIFTWFIMCIINIIPVDLIKGKLFAFDSNSYSSYVINNYLGLENTNINFRVVSIINKSNLFEVVSINVLTLILIFIVSFAILYKRKNIIGNE